MNLTTEVHIKTYQGFTNEEITKALNISERTIQRYRKTESPIIQPECDWFKIADWVIANEYVNPGFKLICYIENGKKKAEVREGNIIHYLVIEEDPHTWDELIVNLLKIDFPEWVKEGQDVLSR